MKHAFFLDAFLACGSVWARSGHGNVPEQPGSIDTNGEPNDTVSGQLSAAEYSRMTGSRMR